LWPEHRVSTMWFRIYEEAQSARKPGAPCSTRCSGRIEKGHADGIISWHPDRLARMRSMVVESIHLLIPVTSKIFASHHTHSRTTHRGS